MKKTEKREREKHFQSEWEQPGREDIMKGKKKKKTEAHQDPEEGRCGKISRITDKETGPKSLPTTNTSSPSAEDLKKGFWLHDV